MTSIVRDTIKGIIKSRRVVSSYVFTDDHGKPYSKGKVSQTEDVRDSVKVLEQ